MRLCDGEGGGAQLMGGRWVVETEGEAEALKTNSAYL